MLPSTLHNQLRGRSHPWATQLYLIIDWAIHGEYEPHSTGQQERHYLYTFDLYTPIFDTLTVNSD